MIFFFALTALRAALVAYFTSVWKRMGIPGGTRSSAHFSVIVPVRNESGNIRNLLEDLHEQTLDFDRFQVIVVDDSSEDDTVEIVKQFKPAAHFDLVLIDLGSEGKQGKKAALTTAVNVASGDYILTTDGDCRLPPTWIESFAGCYGPGNPPVMICGPVKVINDQFFATLQAIEFSSLIGFGAVSLETGHPGTCNGANLSYSRDVFLEVGGYEGNESIPSGDDEFLLIKIWKKYPFRVRFLKSHAALVSTPAKGSPSSLLSQRKRWTSKWKFHKSWYIKSSAILFFADNSFQVVAVYLAIAGIWPGGMVAGLIIIRWLVEFRYLKATTSFSKVPMKGYHFTLIQIIYPFFVIFLGLASIFGKYSWKGRKY